MKSWFLKRGYQEKLVENEMRKVKFGKQGIKKAKGIKGIPIVVTYRPQFFLWYEIHIHSTIKTNKNTNITTR